MFSNPFFTSCFQTTKSQSQQDRDLHSYQLNKQHVSTLPSELGWGLPIRLYRHFWFPEFILPGIISLQQDFPTTSDNIFLVTYPKSGTTWLKALAFAITNRPANYSATNDGHPLLSLHPQGCFPYLEGIFATASVPDITILPTPRILGTHCPYSVLPDSIKNSNARIVYLCREPKDTLVSMWHFINENMPEGADKAAFEHVFELFCKGVAAYGPVWEHQLEYWKESSKRPENVLFLKYEEMKEKPGENVRRLVEFFGKKITEEEEGNGVVEEIVRLCSMENLKGLDVNKEGYRGKEIEWPIKSSSFFRKGTVGDWREHFSPAMADRMDRITKEKLDGSGLSFELQLSQKE